MSNNPVCLINVGVAIQSRLEEKEAAEKRAAKLENEQAELSKRLVDLKMSEIERMNEVTSSFDLQAICLSKAQMSLLR